MARAGSAVAQVEAKNDVMLASEHPLLEELESLMRELVVHYEQLSTLSDRHLEMIRTADARGLAACVRAENEIVQRVAEAEKTRIRVVSGLATELGAPSKGETTMRWIASRVEGPRSGALRVVAERLRGLMAGVSQTNEVARRATETLSRHMEGLMREVARGLNHAKVYGRGGVVESGARVMSGIDIKS